MFDKYSYLPKNKEVSTLVQLQIQQRKSKKKKKQVTQKEQKQKQAPKIWQGLQRTIFNFLFIDACKIFALVQHSAVTFLCKLCLSFQRCHTS